MYRRNFVEKASWVPTTSILPSNLILFFLLDKKNNVVFMELQRNMFEVEPLKVAVKAKKLGYLVMKGDKVIDFQSARQSQQAMPRQMSMAANPNRGPLDMSYGPDGRMARSQLQSISRIAQQLREVLQNNDRLPGWVNTKISTSLDRLSTSYNYLISKMNSMGVKSNPSYIHNGEQMCVMSWLSTLLLSHPMTYEEITVKADGIWGANLLKVALDDLVASTEVVELSDGRYFDKDFAEDQNLI